MSVELSDEKRSMYAEAFDYFQTPAKKGQSQTTSPRNDFSGELVLVS